MQVILLDKVPSLGNLGDRINVRAGYARNFLIPSRKAVLATKQNIAYFDARRAELEEKWADELKSAEVKAAEIMKLSPITIVCKAGSEGKLFGSIGARDIAKALDKVSSYNILKGQIRLPNGVLRTIGDHEVSVQLHNSVFAKITVSIKAESK